MKKRFYSLTKRMMTVVIALIISVSCTSDYTKKIDDNIRAEQIKSMKFGMFVCWSFSTFSGQEWTPTLDKDASYFKVTGCDTDQWCKVAKDAGMNYILFLTKHHDGFCLWDTKTTDKKVTNSPLGIDVLAKLQKSCEKYDIKLALYFSEGDWNWPGASDGKGRNKGIGENPDMKKAQLEELCTNYGPIEFFWMDHAVGDGGLGHKETVEFVHQFQPNCFVGFNSGETAGRLEIRERGKPGNIGDKSLFHFKDHAKSDDNDFSVAEFTYPLLPWHKDGAKWFYSLPEHDDLCHSAYKVYNDYVGAVNYGNIFSLNVGPNYEGRIRDIDVKILGQVGEMIRNNYDLNSPVHAYDVDFNWGEGGPNNFAQPGLWADADPKEHVNWYKNMGCNVIQSFAVSCNGYAWYKNGVVEEQPGLKHDFLTDQVKLAHENNMKIFAYFCAGANTKWGIEHPELSYQAENGFPPNTPHIPYTTEYINYLSTSVEDALVKTNVDGVFIDWLWNPGAMNSADTKWLECEQKMFEELMGYPFPGKEQITEELDLEYRRAAIFRCWRAIKKTVHKTDPACLIWLTVSNLNRDEIANTEILKEVDWVLNEKGDAETTASARSMIGDHTQMVTCLARWNEQDPADIIPDAVKNGFGLYGFTRPVDGTLPKPVDYLLSKPVNELEGDERNMAYLARYYNGLDIEYVKK